MTEVIIKRTDLQQVFHALDQALPELQEMVHEGLIHYKVVEAVERALAITKEHLS